MSEDAAGNAHGIAAGIHAYVVTPVSKEGVLLRASHEAIVERVIAGGCAGVTVLGATGELPYVSRQLRTDLITETVRIVDKRSTVIAGVGGFTSSEIVRQAREAEDLGADGVLVIVQGFLPMAHVDKVALFTELSESIALPMTVYVNPPLCNVEFAVETLMEIADLPTVVGIKDATGNLDSFELSAEFAEKNVRLFAASASPLTAAFLLGASGWMSGTATLFPAVCQQFYEACQRGDWAEASSIERRLSKALGVFRSTGPAVVKALLNAKGIAAGDPLGPNIPIPQSRATELLRGINQVINDERS
ncbi:MAG TPA: dihydrodipicolinate synthase family protein [Terrimesophilobacter sp.]|nr:dihydrodipicolinate synthase family protein [Terrimesophilobacter sp.]HRP99022.1 dihydrodipicolinate synthase family protein [Terrimesophilobacter sp.]